MPRINLGVSDKQLEYEENLRIRFGGMLTATDIGKELGLRNRKSVERWIQGPPSVPAVFINGRRRYMVRDIANKVFERT